MSERNENGKGVSRRTLLGTTAAAAGVGLAGGGGARTTARAVGAADAQTKARRRRRRPRGPRLQKAEVAPGELDEYYTSSPAASPARCASSACRRCAN